MSISLPKPIAEYFAAEKAGDAARLARCFVSDGVVRDEGGRFTGTVAIERRNAAARAKYHHTVAAISSTMRDGATIVRRARGRPGRVKWPIWSRSSRHRVPPQYWNGVRD
jgi:hypothetical protein